MTLKGKNDGINEMIKTLFDNNRIQTGETGET